MTLFVYSLYTANITRNFAVGLKDLIMNDYGELLHNATVPLLIRVIYPSWGSSSNLKGFLPHLQSYSVLFVTNNMNSSEL